MFWAIGNEIGQVALPTFSSSVAKRPEEHWMSPLQTVCNVRETKYFPTNYSPPSTWCVTSGFRDFCGNPWFPFTLRPEYEPCVAGSAVLSLTS